MYNNDSNEKVLVNYWEKEKHDKIVLLAKTKFNSVEVLFSKALIVSNVSLDEFVLVNEVLGSTGAECVSVSAFF